MNAPPTDPENAPLTPKEIRGWVEFCAWTALALAPFLYWVNGPAVSNDQFVVRTALVCLAAVTAVSLRIYAWLERRRAR